MNYVEYKFVGDGLPNQIYDAGMNFPRPSLAPLIFLDAGFQDCSSTAAYRKELPDMQ